jgi:hypothetical protein
MEKKTTFSATGAVLGNYWGGGKGAYEARPVSASSKEELIKLLEQGVEDGSLDSGMGYRSLLGAYMTIKQTTHVTIDGKDFSNDEYEDVVIGNLDEEEIDFLCEVIHHF